jgi:hypothetical protein
MDDMTSLDRQIAAEFLRDAGPSEPVDDAAIFAGVVTATQSPQWSFQPMLRSTTFVVAAAVVALFGGILLVAQPFHHVGVVAPGAESDVARVEASPTPAPRDSLQWGSKRIYYVPPPGFPHGSPTLTFGIHDVARVAREACEDDTYVEVGPTADDLTDALSDLTGPGRSGPVDLTSGPVDVMLSGHPAKRFVLIHSGWSDTPGCPALGEGYRQLWENHDGSGFGMADHGFAVAVIADVAGERLVFAASTFHGPYVEPDADDLVALEAHVDALTASMEIVEQEPAGSAWVTGSTSHAGTRVGAATVGTEDGVTGTRGDHWVDRPITMSDPRLSGVLSVITNYDTHQLAEKEWMTVFSGTTRIANDAGSWEGIGSGVSRGSYPRDAVTETVVLAGSGAYEGLTAYLAFDYDDGPVAVRGLIFPGEMPPVATFE